VEGTATNADRSDYAVTEVRYAPGAQNLAQFLLSYLGGVGKVAALRSGAPAGADIVLVLGRDYNGLSKPKAKATPTTAAGGTRPSSGTAAPAQTSVTSRPEVGC